MKIGHLNHGPELATVFVRVRNSTQLIHTAIAVDVLQKPHESVVRWKVNLFFHALDSASKDSASKVTAGRGTILIMSLRIGFCGRQLPIQHHLFVFHDHADLGGEICHDACNSIEASIHMWCLGVTVLDKIEELRDYRATAVSGHFQSSF